jgi:hypothetical protein
LDGVSELVAGEDATSLRPGFSDERINGESRMAADDSHATNAWLPRSDDIRRGVCTSESSAVEDDIHDDALTVDEAVGSRRATVSVSAGPSTVVGVDSTDPSSVFEATAGCSAPPSA